MKALTLEKIQEYIYQSRPSNQYVISEYDLASILQIELKRLHAKILGATDSLTHLQTMSDAEFDYIKRQRKLSDNIKKNQYCYVFTEEQVGIVQGLFKEEEKAYKIIPLIMQAFESLIIPYEEKTKGIIRQKRRAESIFWWLMVIGGIIIYVLACVAIHPFVAEKESNFYVYLILVIIGIILTVIGLVLPRHKLWGWYSDDKITEEYGKFYQSLIANK